MTTEELWQVLDERLSGLELARAARHDEVIRRLDKINGQVEEHGREITGLKVRDAYGAGIATGVSVVVGWVYHKITGGT